MIGAHSPCKGCITLSSAECTVSPPIFSIYMRACWSMGTVKDHYIHSEKAGDPFCHQCATGVSSLTKEFSVSPTYWDWLRNAVDGWKGKVDKLIEDNLAADEIPATMSQLTLFLFASLVYCYNHLDEHLHEDNRIRRSPLFIAIANDSLREIVTVSYPWNSTQYTPIFTRFPPHVLMMIEIELLRMKLQNQTNSIVSAIVDEFDRRCVDGDSYEASYLLREVQKLKIYV